MCDTGGATLLAPGVRRPLARVDRAAEQDVVRRAYAGTVATERAVRLRGLVAGWQPDLVVRDELDFGAAVAAEALGLPHAEVAVLAAGGLVRQDVLLAARAAPDPGMLGRHLTVGPGLDPAGLGPQPAHVRVDRHVPLAEVLPRCAAVVSHGASATLVAALAAVLREPVRGGGRARRGRRAARG